ncbi:hypothetical protein F5X96DRAFT_616627 [Biscogniauxia mediterranea]|nr:hypothetical protein F5X96DRAFT_616627 [Biscogniauxia mediterranea]
MLCSLFLAFPCFILLCIILSSCSSLRTEKPSVLSLDHNQLCNSNSSSCSSSKLYSILEESSKFHRYPLPVPVKKMRKKEEIKHKPLLENTPLATENKELTQRRAS